MKKMMLLIFVTVTAVVALVSCGKDKDAPAAPVAAAPAPTATPCTGVVQGYATPSCAVAGCSNPNGVQAFPVTVGGTAVTVNALSLSLQTGGAVQTIRMGLYSNHSVNQRPSVLLSQSAAVITVPGTMQTISIPSVSLTAGEIYWVAFNSTPACLDTCRIALGRRFYLDLGTVSTLPALITTGSDITGSQFVGYANACP